MIELYPSVGVRDAYDFEFPDSPYSLLLQLAQSHLLALWFAMSLITNILVTASIISRIFRQLSLAASCTRAT